MILLVANSRDFATDYVVAELRRRGREYLRVDTDLFSLDSMTLEPLAACLRIDRLEGVHEIRAEALEAVYYRAPTHLSESGGLRRSPAERLADHQWAAFTRSLMIFRSARWVNHPQQTYLAENKPYQLMLAASLGFKVARTLVTNALPEVSDSIWNGTMRCAVKALDTFVLSAGEMDLFFYMQEFERSSVDPTSLRSMPVLLQELLSSKIDVRVTVIGERCFPVEIVIDGQGIEGDWRTQKIGARYCPTSLPEAVQAACVRLVRELGLLYGAIDMARVGQEYIFLEINPTGEWAWLVEGAGIPLDAAVTDELCGLDGR